MDIFRLKWPSNINRAHRLLADKQSRLPASPVACAGHAKYSGEAKATLLSRLRTTSSAATFVSHRV